MISIRVKGGTGAGTKRPLVEHKAWTCDCTVTLLNPATRTIDGELLGHGRIFRVAKGETIGHVLHLGTRYSCPDCGARRPLA